MKNSMRVTVAVVVLASLALLAAGCGGSASPTVTVGSTAGDAVAFAHCLRSNGVSAWPDPNSSGAFPAATKQIASSNPRFPAAQRACKHLLPNGGSGPSPAEQQQNRATALRFSQCMRSHGVRNFPDPGSDGRIPDPATLGIDQGAPRFEAANQACGAYRPPYMPSNSAYNAYARTQG